MEKTIFVSIVLLVFLALPQQSLAHSSYMSGTQLKLFSEADKRVQLGYTDTTTVGNAYHFMGYVEGVSDAAVANGLICPPSSVTVGQVEAIVEKYLKNNPEKWNEGGADLVLQSLMPLFPCKDHDNISTGRQ